ncbi:MAG: hypothetical protein NW224_27670 [Leptolyngbyaceae cyanobacterium bins.302]|nr:hypothetical protein [Leptolyngbyaceae cyanobacterium bins.302]
MLEIAEMVKNLWENPGSLSISKPDQNYSCSHVQRGEFSVSVQPNVVSQNTYPALTLQLFLVLSVLTKAILSRNPFNKQSWDTWRRNPYIPALLFLSSC